MCSPRYPVTAHRLHPSNHKGSLGTRNITPGTISRNSVRATGCRRTRREAHFTTSGNRALKPKKRIVAHCSCEAGQTVGLVAAVVYDQEEARRDSPGFRAIETDGRLVGKQADANRCLRSRDDSFLRLIATSNRFNRAAGRQTYDFAILKCISLLSILNNRSDVEAETRSSTFTNIANLRNDGIMLHRPISQQLLRCADYRRLKACLTTNALDIRPHGWIRDVLAVPCQLVLYTVYGRNGNMQCVNRRFLRQWHSSNQCVGQCVGFTRQLKKRNSLQIHASFLCRNRVTLGAFIHNKTGDEDLETLSLTIPPISRCLLVRCNSQHSTHTHRQIPDDRCFQIDGGLHGGPLARSLCGQQLRSQYHTGKWTCAYTATLSEVNQPLKSQFRVPPDQLSSGEWISRRGMSWLAER
jgi:hypothetical protein